jgi:hypothetical protein
VCWGKKSAEAIIRRSSRAWDRSAIPDPQLPYPVSFSVFALLRFRASRLGIISFVFPPLIILRTLFQRMRTLTQLCLSLVLLDFTSLCCYALRVPFDVRSGSVSPPSFSLGRRAPISVINTGNAQYSANMTIGGVAVRVLLDTGRFVRVKTAAQNLTIF